MKKSFRILLTLVLAVVMVLSLTACLSDCEAGKHAFVDVAAKPATCETAGNIAYKKCPVCGLCVDTDGKQITEADITIAAIGHVFDKEVATPAYLQTEATCGNPATYFKSCVCGEKGTETFTVGDASSHVYNQEVVHADYLASAATCTAKATYYKSCTCGAKGTETFEHGDLAAHTYGTWNDGTPATCQATGTKAHQYCSVCEKNYDADDTLIADITIAKDSSNHVDLTPVVATPASCTADGILAHSKCACGATLIDGKVVTSVVDAKKPHTYGTWNEGTPATCQATGTKAHQHCSVCEKNYDADGVEIADITIAKDTTNGHKAATDWTVGEDGKHYHVCQNGCGTYLDEAAHVYDQTVATDAYADKAATCTAKATYFKSCVCGEKGTETFEHGDLAAHTYGTWNDGTPATCQATGTKAHQYCSVCEKNYDADDTLIADITIAKDSSNHVDLTPVVATPASCTADGILAHSKCACGATLIDGKVVTSVVDAKKPHTYGTWNEGTPATCQATGTKGHYICSVCEKNYDADDTLIADLTIAIDSNAHDYKYADTSSTKHTVTCGREGCTYTAQLVEHSYAADTHKCLCGKTEPKVGWHLVTDASDLAAGDQIIIVGSKDPKFYTIGTTQNNNNRAAVEITKNADGSFALGDTVQIIVIAVGNKEGTFALSVGTNSYLFAAGGTKDNHLKTTTTLDDKASWTIEISQQGVATIKAVDSDTTKNWLRYNSINGIFSCYGSGQNDISIYKYYPACDHVGKETETTTVEATCTTDGATTVTCKYCGEAISTTVINGGHVYGTPDVDASDSTKHTYTCTREGCENSYSEAHIYENHVCTKCNADEPSYKITVTNTAIDGNSATVVVKVGDDVISAGDDGKYSIYQNSNVTITITAPEGYMLDVVKMDSAELESFSGTHSFTITADVTFEVTIKVIPAAHTCDFKTPAKLDSADEKYTTHHKMVCECGKADATLVAHNLTPVQIEGNETQHKLVCVCGYEELVDHDFDPNTHKCVGCGLSRLKTIAQALEACGELENKAYSNDIWYVQGYVVGTPEYSSTYSNYTLNIATELGGETVLKVYGLKLNGKSGIYENDLIVVSGYLQKYDSTLEITFQGSTDCLLATYTAGTSAISVSSESSANATVTITDGKTSGENGTNFTFTVVAASGYEVTSVKVNGNVVTAGEDGKYTATIQGATTILVATKEEGSTEPIEVVSLTFPNAGGNKVSGYTTTWTATSEGYNWQIANFNANSWNNDWTYIKCGSKKVASVAHIATATAMVQSITKVVVKIDKVTADKVNSIKLVVATDAAFAKEDIVTEISAASIKSGDLTFNITNPQANLYYKVVFDCQKSSNGIVQVSKISYYA